MAVQNESAATGRTRHLPGEVGVWIFILLDLLVFGVVFGAFMLTRGEDPQVFIESQNEVHRFFGGLNTLILLTSSLAVFVALQAMRRGQGRLARRAIIFAIVCGCLFLVDKGVEWVILFSDEHGPATNDYFTWFFSLTGLHAAHVVVGLEALTIMYVWSRRPSLTPEQQSLTDGFACFWHMVDLLWIVIFTLLYLMH